MVDSSKKGNQPIDKRKQATSSTGVVRGDNRASGLLRKDVAEPSHSNVPPFSFRRNLTLLFVYRLLGEISKVELEVIFGRVEELLIPLYL
ncbi:hypothetical protein AAC387_Pa07g2477 [Persea americana]